MSESRARRPRLLQGLAALCALAWFAALPLAIQAGDPPEEPAPLPIWAGNPKCKTTDTIGVAALPQAPFFGNVLVPKDPKTLTMPTTPKAISAAFLFASNSVKPKGDPLVTFGTTGTPMTVACDFMIGLIDDKERDLARYGIWDPRKIVSDQDKKGLVVLPEAMFAVHFPFSPRARAIRVYDAEGHTLLTSDVTKAMTTFCDKQPKDPSCTSNSP